jgi:hypothetical protein
MAALTISRVLPWSPFTVSYSDPKPLKLSGPLCQTMLAPTLSHIIYYNICIIHTADPTYLSVGKYVQSSWLSDRRGYLAVFCFSYNKLFCSNAPTWLLSETMSNIAQIQTLHDPCTTRGACIIARMPFSYHFRSRQWRHRHVIQTSRH